MVMFGIVLSFEHYIVLPLVLGAILIGLTINFISYVERSRKNLIQLLESIKYKDFTTRYSIDGNMNSGDQKLNAMFNEISDVYRNQKSEAEGLYHYLETVNEHLQVGLISFKENGEISLLNQTAKDQLDIKFLQNINDLSNSSFLERVRSLKSGEQELIKLDQKDVLIYSTKFKLKDEIYTIISLQNITNELSQKELNSWKKLIRVLSHEIMNSVTPMLSLSKASKAILLDEENSPKTDLTTDDLEDISDSMNLIEKRGEGLIQFVKSYRKITQIPEANIQKTNIKELIDKATSFYKAELENIGLKINVEDKELMIDPVLIEQVILNLLINSKQALANQENPIISIQSEFDERFKLHFTDNGCGISESDIDQLFIPFFTTKPTGSGIGLSLSKEIMMLHNGSIEVTSNSDQTTFTLCF